MAREPDDPQAIVNRKVGVEPPTQAAEEALDALDVRDGDRDGLQLHVAPRALGVSVPVSLRT